MAGRSGKPLSAWRAADGTFILPEAPMEYASRWMDRLLKRMEKAPIVEEDEIDAYGFKAHLIGLPLTKRELQVLECMSRGLGRKGTADLLFISEATVMTHLLRSRIKLRTKNHTHTVSEALRQGIIK